MRLFKCCDTLAGSRPGAQPGTDDAPDASGRRSPSRRRAHAAHVRPSAPTAPPGDGTARTGRAARSRPAAMASRTASGVIDRLGRDGRRGFRAARLPGSPAPPVLPGCHLRLCRAGQDRRPALPARGRPGLDRRAARRVQPRLPALTADPAHGAPGARPRGIPHRPGRDRHRSGGPDRSPLPAGRRRRVRPVGHVLADRVMGDQALLLRPGPALRPRLADDRPGRARRPVRARRRLGSLGRPTDRPGPLRRLRAAGRARRLVRGSGPPGLPPGRPPWRRHDRARRRLRTPGSPPRAGQRARSRRHCRDAASPSEWISRRGRERV